jgi:DNA-binding MarR family transcriptional regulator
VHPGPAAEPLERLLVRTGQALQRFIQRAAAAHGLSVTALEVLGALVEHDGCSHRDLAGRLRLAPATLTPVLDSLEAAGALTRDRDGVDRRVVRVSITDPGRERYVAVARGVERAVAELPEPSPAQAAAIRAHLRDLLAAVDRADPRDWLGPCSIYRSDA